MSVGQRVSRFIFYTVWAVLMTVLTYVLGGVSLKALRKQAGRAVYWLVGTSLGVGFYVAGVKPLGIAFFSLVLLIGVFSELEELGLSFTMSAFFTLLINSLVTGGTFALWVSRIGPKWSGEVQNALQTAFKPLTQINPNFQINYGDLMMQVPSIVVILWMAAIYLAVLLEPRLTPPSVRKAEEVEGQDDRLSMRAQLGDLRMPDAVVWVLILALLGAFGGFAKKPIEALSFNVLNVCFVLFFFQGIAVVSRFFDRLRMGSFWQFLFMVLIVVHLSFVVSLLGLLDYWIDFRARLAKRPQEYNRET